jgi:chromosome segregation ATPase
VEARAAATVAHLDAAGAAADREAILGEVEARMQESMAEPLERVEQLHADLDAVRTRGDELRAELLDALVASEEKALGAAVHLESLIVQVQRRLVGDEAEWSAVVGEAGEAVASLRSRVEDLLERVCSVEARHAADRGAWGPQLEGIGRRLDTHEEWARAAVAEASALDLRLNALDARIAALSEVRSLAEEQAGSIEYLKDRMQAMGERLGAPAPATSPDAAALAARLDELATGQVALSRRLEELEAHAEAARRERF